jgi:mycothiol synthase
MDDLEAVAKLAIALDESVLGFSELTVDDVRVDWSGLDLERDAWVIEDDRRLVGHVHVAAGGTLCADGFVHPDFLGRGIGARLVDLSEKDARARGAPVLMNGVLSADERACDLLESLGYRPIRHYFRMLIELDGEQPLPVWPVGVTLATLDDVDARAFHASLEEAFADEWDHSPESYEDWRRRRIEGRQHDPSLFFAVLDGDEIAAVAVCDWKRFGMGWVGAVAVREPWRRRGLGLALLQHSFREFRSRGEQRVGLAVDAQNPTGATRLYDRAGMRLSWSATFFEKRLA